MDCLWDKLDAQKLQLPGKLPIEFTTSHQHDEGVVSRACDCFGDFHTCCLTFWCPCVTFGRTAEIVDRGTTSCCMNGTLYYLLATIGCQWVYGCTKRSSMRAQYNLQESPCLDCCVHFWCGPCALCQEYKELEKHGFNMAKGWEGSNKVVGCFQGMTTPPRKQSMCF